MRDRKITYEKLTSDNISSDIFDLPVEMAKNILRQIREKECYSIINRGELWYSLLTDEQKEELKAWYQAWLDVTETMIIPAKPSWLR